MPIYLKIDSIDGSATETGHKDQVEVETMSWGLARTVTHVTGGGANKVGDAPQFMEFSFQKRLDKASTKLFAACAAGTYIKKVVIDVVGTQEGKAEQFENIELDDVVVTSYTQGGTRGDLPSEQFALNFAKINFKQISRDTAGKTSPMNAGWDVKENKKV
jgi:type VI secretion system secreted protein Hcp